MEERIQKLLAGAGVASRRACEELIRQGRVIVNGQTAQLGQKADPARDRITVDGTAVQFRRRHVYLAVHKPPGVLCTTHDPQGRPTVLDLIPHFSDTRLWPVGRLDLDSEGLVLLTDDGEMTYQLTHPRFEHDKEYRALVVGRPTREAVAQLQQGVVLDNRRTAPAQVQVLRQDGPSTWWLRLVLHEGRKRQIRRMLRAVGYPAKRLIRVRIGSLHLGDLAPGQWRRLTAPEIRDLTRSQP
ncbi:MAG: rRNA pseudouridine synthase [Chloroflexi bacterium]|nr:rRNA pseudouridine synthase [Chloroflexota bacterium]MBU1751210.1 rRNA pseudouridine synthase [Chloroflexota bacterium]